MGGLVARWFLEVLGGWEVTRRLITIGTPYQGAIGALDTLCNGVAKGVGLPGGTLQRKFGAFRQPTNFSHLSLRISRGETYIGLEEATEIDLEIEKVRAAAEFRRTIAESARRRGDIGDAIVAIRGN